MRTVDDLLKGCFVNIDKPIEKTSHDIDLIIRKIFNVKKSSHFGTLDPAVTGVLPIAIGKAVKLFQYIRSGKEYVGVMKIHGEKHWSIKELQEVINGHFTGKIRQVPPVKSAVKRVEREREIYSFKVIENEDNLFLFEVSCEAGTYIRKLIHDLGEKLGCGAHMAELRRTKAGMFEENNVIRIDDLVRAVNENDEKKLIKCLIPKEAVLKDIKEIKVNEWGMKRAKQGGPIFEKDIVGKSIKLSKGDKIGLTFEGELIAVMRVLNEEGALAKPDSVLI